MNKIRAFFANKWVAFTSMAILYTLWFVVWTGNLWLLLGLPLIYDAYISKIFYRLVWRHNKTLCERSSLYKTAYEWVNALVFATVVATLVHTFVFQMYVIPTSSMEKSLLVGDYLYVSKVTYGPKMPNTPIAFPFVHHTMPLSTTKKSFCEAIKWPYKRLAGFRGVERGDAVVFNFPAGDTVLLEKQAITYYDELRAYEDAYGKDEGRKKLFDEYTVISRPVDKRENYIKRAVGIPGDSLQVIDSEVWINGEPNDNIEHKEYIYIVQTSKPISNYAIENLDITEYNGNGSVYQMVLTKENAEKIAELDGVLSVNRYTFGPSADMFPHVKNKLWSPDNFGPIWVPAKGATITLTDENLPLYSRIIETYEGNSLEVKDGQIYINGEPTDSYTFQMDYYWMMGDNRHNSADSRFWGFVPEDHIVGKASFITISLDKNKSFPANIRWDRVFSKVR